MSATIASEDAGGAIPGVSAHSGGTQSIDNADAHTDALLAGSGAAFLLLGVVTLGVAHRRRWRAAVSHERSAVDLREPATEAAPETVHADAQTTDPRQPATDAAPATLQADAQATDLREQAHDAHDQVIDLRDGAAKHRHA